MNDVIPQQPRRTGLVGVRVTPDEMARLKLAARTLGVSIASMMRSEALRLAREITPGNAALANAALAEAEPR